MKKKILLIGWDAADWKIINPLLDAGQMPNFERLVNEGVIGNLATLYPILSPMLWTSVATGKRAFKHGICGFIEPDPQTGGVRPITNISRKTKAIWNILNQSGMVSNVVGWWPSHPAEPLNGVMVSNHFQQAPRSPRTDRDPRADWPIPARGIHPSRLEPHLKPMRIHPLELDGEMLLPFVPRAAEINQREDQRLVHLAKTIAECSSVHAAATAIMQLEPWDFMAVYYDAIDHFCHGFMKYHPPRLNWVNEEDFQMYRDVIQGAYRYHDLMLGTLLELAGDDTTVILMSDHGFHSDHLRPSILPNEPVGPAAEHRPLGIFVMRGPGIRRDERIYGATLLDVAPTILHLFGLPIGRDMDGRVLSAALESPAEVEFVESWDLIEGPSGQHPLNLRLDAIEAQAAMDQLVALGYIDEPDEDKAIAAAHATRELKYHRALAHIDAQQQSIAVDILSDLWSQWPDELRFGVALLQCQLALGQVTQARATLDTVKKRKSEGASQAAAEVQRFHQENPQAEVKDLPRHERVRFRRLRARAETNRPALAYLEASVLHCEKRYEESLRLLKRVEATDAGRRGGMLLKQGEILLQLRRGAEAEDCFRQVLELDPLSPDGHLGMCRRRLQQRKYLDAAESARHALGSLFHQPQAHYFHGVALRQCGEIELAVCAIETALRQNPNFPLAHAKLAMIYDRDVQDNAKADFHRREAQRVRQFIRQQRRPGQRPQDQAAQPDCVEEPEEIFSEVRHEELRGVPASKWIVIVSGLPRSGTSLMMQMLEAGGVPIRTDQIREPDVNNPRGYLELEKVKGLAKDSRWVADSQGHALKVVAQLVAYLPRHLHYKFIFLDRDLQEVIQSQETMIDQLDSKPGQKKENLRAVFQKQLSLAKQTVRENPNAEMITIAHRETIDRPAVVARRVAEFLEFPSLDLRAMAQVVDGHLYRSRSTIGPG